jgi:hypothetical protein
LKQASRELLEKIRAERGVSAKGVAERFKITQQEAEDFLRRQAGFTRKAGPLEYARITELPEDILERNPLEVLRRYDQQMFRRLTSAKQFGVENQKLEQAIQAAVNEGLNPNTAQLMRNAVLGVKDPRWLDKIAPSILGFQVLSKMGPTSAITNISQRVNAAIAYNMGNYARGQMKLASNPAFRERSMLAATAHLRQQMEHLVGQATIAEKVGTWPRKWLGVVGFNWVEKGNRSISYAAGVASAENLAKASGGQLTKKLAQMGATAEDMRLFQQHGRFLPAAERRIGMRAAKETQFAPGYLDLPPLWQTPEARLLFQFKSFIHQQTRFLTNQVIRPAAKYLETGGKEGDIGPLMRALIAYPVAGQGVAAARDLFQEYSAETLGAKRRKPRKFDYDHPVAQLVKDSMYVGAFGMAGDVLTAASRGRLLDWAAGPSISDVTENFEFLSRHGAAGRFPRTEDLLGRLYRHLPGRRLVPLEPQEVVGGLSRRFR